MNKFFTLGNEILSTDEYSVLATAVSDEVAEHLVELLNKKVDSESTGNTSPDSEHGGLILVNYEGQEEELSDTYLGEDEDNFDSDWCGFCERSVTTVIAADGHRVCPYCTEEI
jgi:hypothetical protein